MRQTQPNRPSRDFEAGARAVRTVAEETVAGLEATPGFSARREGYAVAALRGLIRAGTRVEQGGVPQRTS